VFVFMSNCDNMGAVVDAKILAKLAADKRPYLAEVVPKTPDDWKGGMPIRYHDGVRLLETAQVPKEHMKLFIDVTQFKTFHANNLWVSLEALKAAVSAGTLKLDAFPNKKAYRGKPIFQLEAAAGSAIQSWPDSGAIIVPRDRFLPVKTTVELVLMRSDFFVKGAGARFATNPARDAALGLPHLELDALYSSVSSTEAHFPSPLGLVGVESLVVKGEVTFGKNVTLAGSVTFDVPPGWHLVVPDGAIIANKTITSPKDLTA
jgi:UTP--glucose-1-phosphate uridylyltransferase